MFFIASASVKHHYMFTSWASVEANGVTFQWGRTMDYIIWWPFLDIQSPGISWSSRAALSCFGYSLGIRMACNESVSCLPFFFFSEVLVDWHCNSTFQNSIQLYAEANRIFQSFWYFWHCFLWNMIWTVMSDWYSIIASYCFNEHHSLSHLYLVFQLLSPPSKFTYFFSLSIIRHFFFW